jgi:hypothetical protein
MFSLTGFSEGAGGLFGTLLFVSLGENYV